MSKAYLSLGSNLGNKENNLLSAIEQINTSCGKVETRSSFYTTPPWGFDSSNEFLNAAIILNTDFKPELLLQHLQGIEKNTGRIRVPSMGYIDRVLDIDIICFDNITCNTPTLTIPHPHLQSRLFVLEPLAEIAPDYIHPIFKKSIRQLLRECTDSSMCKKR